PRCRRARRRNAKSCARRRPTTTRAARRSRRLSSGRGSGGSAPATATAAATDVQFETAPAPHATPLTSVTAVMLRVLLALVPAAIVYTWFFGFGLLINFVVAAIAALVTEAAVLKLRGRPTRAALRDLSALVTAALLAFAIPPLVPWWVPALGRAVAIGVAKQLYGGLGKNLFHSAMVGYVLLPG